jgi:ribosome-binding protein aMBF1 (putative translation factor)
MPRRTGRPPGYKPDGPEIYRLRVRVHGLSAAELAAKVRFSVDSVWAAERGQNISDVFASRLAKALGVEIEDIASRDGGDDTESDAETKIPA